MLQQYCLTRTEPSAAGAHYLPAAKSKCKVSQNEDMQLAQQHLANATVPEAARPAREHRDEAQLRQRNPVRLLDMS
jgi:hypothetical protein